MSARQVLDDTDFPRTRGGLARDLEDLGVTPGEVLLVHSSLSALGWVCGDEVAVIQALGDALGDAGTLAMPAHTAGNVDPARWDAPAVPESWWEAIREGTPAYDPALTPCRVVGRIPEAFRRWPGTRRSAHPRMSFAARGPAAAALTSGHALDFALGETSPLARLEEAGARVLLLGVGFDVCTAFHLAEYRAADRRETHEAAVILEGGRRAWREYRDLELREDDFGELGEAFEAAERADPASGFASGPVGSATARLFSLPRAVAYAAGWFARNPRPGAP